jgi:Flp pilus assembly protein TadD
MMKMHRDAVLPAALAACAAVALAAIPARSAPMLSARELRPERHVLSTPPAETAAPDDRLRALVARIDKTRAQAAAPGLNDEQRDALAEMAWAQADEVLEDPDLRERAQRDPDFLQAQALLLMDDGEDEDALAVLKRLAVIAPRDPETHRLLALAYMGLGLATGATEEFRLALALNVDAAAEVRAHLAYTLAVAGSLEEGLLESERAIAQAPSAYLGHFIRGWILGESGRFVEERREYLQAVKLERDDADLWESLAQSWERAGEVARAREAWREVVRIDPSDETAAKKAGAKP